MSIGEFIIGRQTLILLYVLMKNLESRNAGFRMNIIKSLGRRSPRIHEVCTSFLVPGLSYKLYNVHLYDERIQHMERGCKESS